MRSIRTRFILSHLLPIVLIMPFMGFALVYLLEKQVLLNNISQELTAQAVLMAQLTVDRPAVWVESNQAGLFVSRLSPYMSARIMLLDRYGYLLASSDPTDQVGVSQLVEVYDYQQLENGDVVVHKTYALEPGSEIADVFVPVMTISGEILGVVRLTYNRTGVYDRFLQVRTLIVLVLFSGLVLGAVLGWLLGLNLEKPLRQLTAAVGQLGRGEQFTNLPEYGPQEMRVLVGAFNSLVERLRSLEAARKQLLANLVHELGRPLGALRSAVQALLGGANQNPVLSFELLTGMDEQIARLQRLLDDLARLYAQVLGSLELNRQPLPLGDWLLKALAPWRQAAKDKRLDWVEELPEVLPGLEADADRLDQALGNLLSNAIKYTPPGGRVSVQAGIAEQEVWIQVSDTGPDIPEDEQQKIFEPFYRGSQGGRFPQGMGLGLSIARDVVAAHQGRIEVDSHPGLGSSFTIFLPL